MRKRSLLPVYVHRPLDDWATSRRAAYLTGGISRSTSSIPICAAVSRERSSR